MDPGEAKRRIAAARILRDMTQEEMSRRGAEDWGLGAQELSRTERGTLDFTPARRMVLCKVLSVPDSWFDDPVDVLVGNRPRAPLSPEATNVLLEQLLAGHAQAADQARRETEIRPADEDRPDAGQGGAGA